MGKKKGRNACFKRRASADLNWLDFSPVLARPYQDLVSEVEFNSLVE